MSSHDAAADHDPAFDAPLYNAVLRPHRSLKRGGFRIVMLLVSVLSLAGGLVFYLIGAWPVVGFLGLDVLLVYGAFRASFRSARATEEIIVTAATLTVRKTSHHGRRSVWSANPLWVRLDRDEDPDYGLQRLTAVSRNRQCALAGLVGPAERRRVADGLASALWQARRGPTRTVFD